MYAHLHSEQKSLIRKEMVVSALLGGLLPAAILWLFFQPIPLPLSGRGGFAEFIVINTVMMSAAMSLLMTLGIRGRLARTPSLRAEGAGESRLLKIIPRRLALRVPFFALCALAILSPIGILGADALALDPIGRTALSAFMGLYCGSLALMLTPFIAFAALHDRTNAPAKHEVAPT